jgi:hypothetical protein
VAYIASRSARSSTRWSASSSYVSIRARARASSSSVTGSRPSARAPPRRRARRRRIDARPDRRLAGRDRRPADKPEREEGHVLGDPLLADEAPVQPAALAAGQDLAATSSASSADRRRPAPGSRSSGAAAAPILDTSRAISPRASAAGSCRRAAGSPGWPGSRRSSARPRPGLAGIDVADDREDRVVRRVVGPEERRPRPRATPRRGPPSTRSSGGGTDAPAGRGAPGACGTSRRTAGCRTRSASRS